MLSRHGVGWASISPYSYTRKTLVIKTDSGFLAKVIEAKWLTNNIFSVWLENPKSQRKPKPGQFFGVKVPTHHHLLLRRPVSVADFYQNRIRLVIRVVGQGTAAMSQTAKEAKWDLLGPLGKPAPLVRQKDVIVCGGGVGIAPLLYLTKWLKRNNRVTVILGAKTPSDLILLDNFRKLDLPVSITTENGALGKKGVVTDLIPEVLSRTKKPVIYACGPKQMLLPLKQLAGQVTVLGFLEQRMGCGTGICYCCGIKKTIGGYLRVCRDGPVVNLNQVLL